MTEMQTRPDGTVEYVFPGWVYVTEKESIAGGLLFGHRYATGTGWMLPRDKYESLQTTHSADVPDTSAMP